MRRLILSGIAAFAAIVGASAVLAEEAEVKLPKRDWGFEGPFGTYDRAAAQRGFQVYKEVCSACHSLDMLYYRNLMDLGLTEAQVKGIAAEVQVPDIGDDGSPIERPARPSDHFKKPFANELAAAAANNGKAPPDLSVIIKAREGHANYVLGILTGYVPLDKVSDAQKKEFSIGPDDNFNTFYPGHRIAMPPPLADGKVTYADGTKNTLEQQASDVVEFLAWASEPHLEDRNRTGVRVILFLLVMSGFLYALKRAVWADKH